MGSWLSEREMRLVAGAETASAATPIPTQIVSNGEYLPPKQSETQKRVERRILELADENAKKLGLSRRQFMATGCGMAAAFLAMKEIYGTNVFQVDAAEAHQPDLIQARAQSLAGQFVFDVQTHFVRDDFDHKELLGLNDFAAEHWNPKIKDRHRAGIGAVQVPQLCQGDLLRQRYPACAAERGAIRRSDMVAALQRADRQDAANGQRFRRDQGACSPTPSSRPSSPVGWRRSIGRSRSTSRIRGNPTRSVIRSRRPNSRGVWTTRS